MTIFQVEALPGVARGESQEDGNGHLSGVGTWELLHALQQIFFLKKRENHT